MRHAKIHQSRNNALSFYKMYIKYHKQKEAEVKTFTKKYTPTALTQ